MPKFLFDKKTYVFLIMITIFMVVFYGFDNKLEQKIIIKRGDAGISFVFNGVAYSAVEKKLKNVTLYSLYKGDDRFKISIFKKGQRSEEKLKKIIKNLNKRKIFVADFKKTTLIDEQKKPEDVYYSVIESSDINGGFFSFDIIKYGYNLVYDDLFFIDDFVPDYKYVKEFPRFEMADNVKNIKKVFNKEKKIFEVFNIKSLAKIIDVSVKNDDASLINWNNLYFYYSAETRKIEPAILFLNLEKKYHKSQGIYNISSRFLNLFDNESIQLLRGELTAFLREKKPAIQYSLDPLDIKNHKNISKLVKVEHFTKNAMGYVRIKNNLDKQIKLLKIYKEQLLYPIISKPLDTKDKIGDKIYINSGEEIVFGFNWLRMSKPFVSFKINDGSKKIFKSEITPSFDDFDFKNYPYLWKCKSCLTKKDKKLILKDGGYVIRGVLEIPKDMTLELSPGVIFKFHYKAGIKVKGKLIAKGHKDKKVVFTSYNKDSNYNQWQYFKVLDKGEVVLNNSVIENLSGAETKASSAIEVYKSTFFMKDSQIKNIEGKSAILAVNSFVDISNSKVENIEDAFLRAKGSQINIKDTQFKQASRKTGDSLIYSENSKLNLSGIRNLSYAKNILSKD